MFGPFSRVWSAITALVSFAMAPTANGDVSMPMIPRNEPSIVEDRSLSSSGQGNMGPVLHREEVELLGALTIAAATISIIAGSLSLFWFLRMRKAFRHQFVPQALKDEAKLIYSLIMLLILSNLWRALWYFLFPIIGFARGTISSQSAFCQVSGFMLSYGIEGADFSVLVMSIHAALSIFHSSAALGERGLYPIRHTVFVLWVLLPAFASGLAFVNRSGGYTTSGAYCYLPIRPFWYRLALSWIPRYLILVMIASIYLAIYLFVKRNFNHYHLSEHSSDKLPSSGHGRQSTRLPVSRKSEGEVSGSRVPTSTEPSYPNQDLRTIAEHNDEKGDHRTTPAWERYTFGAATPLAKPAESDIVTTDPSILKTSKRSDSDNHRTSTDSRESNTYIIQALRESQPTSNKAGCTTSGGSTTLRLTDSNNETIEDATMRARHRQIKRQMRFLFVYPVVYLITWIVPFVSHCLSYSDQYVRNPNFGLTAASTVILALQCAIDTILFTTREKPWRTSDSEDPTARTFIGSLTPRFARRHLPRTFSQSSSSNERGASDSTAHRSLVASAARTASSILHIRGPHGGDERVVADRHRSHFHAGGVKSSGGGRSRGQNVAEARVAQERKDAENAQAREAAWKRRSQREVSIARRGGRDRSWWEVEGRQRKDSVWLGTEAGTVPDHESSPQLQTGGTSQHSETGQHLQME